MANYTSSANIILTVNGKQAQKMLGTLQKDAQTLEKKLAAAVAAGDKTNMKKLQLELNRTRNLIDQISGSTQSAEHVLRNLDKASPKELQKTLNTLTRQLDGIERGSDAWKKHVEKIRAVRQELARVNEMTRLQEGSWSRVNRWLNDCQTSLMGIAAALIGMIMAGRRAVNEFAKMDESLANTKKYTGMAWRDVYKLNEEFRRMDTRTTREELNLLAQEAGRLGKNTLKDVKGYTEAAEIIKVALVDLGEGATQDIAKLTNIFGVEEMLGTKEAMLAVGSTVNVLSQNCTASKPYLVEFAKRMAGIGSQAGLTIPEIIAFGAVLDANGQKVEMSATAIQKVIMNLANKNKEFAQTLGMDAEKLNETLKRSAKDGLLMFLEQLHKIGEKSSYDNATMILAPAFKEMGLDAARVSQVLSTLAKHVDEVKWQLGEANNAFNQASSATKEYEIFNNTAQASIDKAKNRVNELAISLGEKLYPLMKHIYTPSGVFLRVLNQLVSFFIRNRSEIIAVTSAIAAYNIIMLVAATRTKIAAAAQALFNSSVTLGSRIIPAFRLLLVPLINTVQYFTNGLQVNYAMQQRWRNAMAAMSFGNWLGLLAAASAIYILTKRISDSRNQARKAAAENAAFVRSLTDVDKAAAEAAEKEVARASAIYHIMKDESKARDMRLKAAEKLQKLYPEIFRNFTTEQMLVENTTMAYVKLHNAVLEAAKAQAAMSLYRENTKKLIEVEQQMDKLAGNLEFARQQEFNAQVNRNKPRAGETVQEAYYRRQNATANQKSPEEIKAEQRRKKIEDQIDALRKKRAQISIANMSLEEKYDLGEMLLSGSGSSGDPGDFSASDSGSIDKAKEDKFKAEKEWKEREEALARIAYATGQTDYITHTDRMNEIQKQYHEKQLQHQDLTENERLSITAQYEELKEKIRKQWAARSIDEENQRHDAESAQLKQHYIDGLISRDTYNSRTEELEATHLRRLASLYKEGSKERIDIEAKLTDRLVKEQQRREQETEKRRKALEAVKDKYFGDNASERTRKYKEETDAILMVYLMEIKAAQGNKAELLRIHEAYLKARAAIDARYNLQSEKSNPLKAGVQKSIEWLNSDGGKAFTESMNTVVSGMSAVFSQLSDSIEAELELQTAALTKRYDSEIAAAEGNSYKIRVIEKRKEKELARLKNEANRKMFAMQVIQAVAQTATNALAAYGSAAAIPVVGHIMAPIAAAMAVAAGMMQVTAIKKQQSASEAQGYSEGGYTPKGPKDKPVGIVHAGEWVASQALVNNPATRPLIETLDKAQRSNRIGSITHTDVSRSITATMRSADHAAAPATSTSPAPTIIIREDSEYTAAIRRLSDRLDDPFVTVTTIEGDHGIKQAKERYDTLIKNKQPKSHHK